MKRLQTVETIGRLEKKRMNLENLLKDVGNDYSKEVYMTLDIMGLNYNKQYEGQTIDVNKTIFIGYLKEEIKFVENKINRLIRELV